MNTMLFKAIREDNSRWVKGYGICVIPNQAIATIIHNVGGNLMHHTDIIGKTICEFTGLFDANGVQIFEGDSNGQVYVGWNQSQSRYSLYSNQTRDIHCHLQEMDMDRFEVTGNIHDKQK